MFARRSLTSALFASCLVSVSCSDRELLGRLPSVGSPAPTDSGVRRGGAAFRGKLIFEEHFDDGNLTGRGWIDLPGGSISTEEHAPGSSSSFDCQFKIGQVSCVNGRPGRFVFDGVGAIYVAYWIKYSENFVASSDVYFQTNLDPAIGVPGESHLFTSFSYEGARFVSKLADNANIDTTCLKLNPGTVVGCGGGAFETYPFTEARSVNACNGIEGDPAEATCAIDNQSSTGYLSRRGWQSAAPPFTSSSPGKPGKADWHFVEQYFALNDVAAGVGVRNGQIRVWVDGDAIIERTGILLRTGAHPDMLFNELLVAPWAPEGASNDQRLWIDELVLAQGVR